LKIAARSSTISPTQMRQHFSTGFNKSIDDAGESDCERFSGGCATGERPSLDDWSQGPRSPTEATFAPGTKCP
jgi:hypothetical protein